MNIFNNNDDIPEPFKKYSSSENTAEVNTNTVNSDLHNNDVSTANIKAKNNNLKVKNNDFNDMLFILLILIIFFDNI